MAKAGLQALLTKIIAESSKKAGYRDTSDTFVHTYETTLSSLIQEVEEQISGAHVTSATSKKYKLTTEQKKVISDHCLTYFTNVKTSLKSTRFFNIEFLKTTPDSFIVEISGNKKGYNVFGFINKIREPHLNKLRKDILTELSTSISDKGTLDERILGSYNPNTGSRSGGLLQLGHLQGVSVAEQRASRYLASLDLKVRNLQKKGTVSEEHPILKLQAIMATNPKSKDIKRGKISIVGVKEQGQKSNRNQATAEQNLIAFIRKEIQDSIKNENWAEFKSSPSAIDIVIGRLSLEAKKAGAKKYDKKAISLLNTKSKSEASDELKGKTTRSYSSDSIKATAKQNGDAGKSSIKPMNNWASLVAIINTKLPERVANNMKLPGLVYRTGRFANSTKVVNVETTRDGYASIVFDYERDPYDVFDKIKGASPWNTPQRDPRALVDKSVREIVQEMAIGRFYTRRA